MWWCALWDVCIFYSLMLISLLVWSLEVCVWDTWLNHFLVINQLYLDYFLVTVMGLKCLFWSWWCHVVTCLTWPFWESLISIILGYFPVACWELKCIVIYFEIFYLISHWELMDIVIYHLMLFSYSWRTDVIIVDYILMLSSRLYRIEVIFWFMILWV